MPGMKHKIKYFTFILLFFNCLQIKAQLFEDVFVFRNIRPDFSIEAKQTSLRGHNVQLLGFRGGMQWQKKYKAGLGYYFMSSKVDEKLIYQGIEVPARLKFNLVSVYGEFTFYQSNKWTLNAGLQPGVGWKNNQLGANTKLEKEVFMSLEPNISGNYKILYWVGLGGGLGYRQVLLGYPLSAYRLSGPDINFNVVIFFDALFKKFILGQNPE